MNKNLHSSSRSQSVRRSVFIAMKRRLFLISLAMTVALAGVAMPAEAAVEMFSADYGSAGSPVGLGTTEDLSLGKFDTSLGTLDSITIDLFSENTVQSEIINFTTGNLPYTSTSTTFADTVTALNGLTTSVTASAGPFSGTASARSVTVDGSSTPTSANSSAAVAPGDFPLYEGVGPQTFDVSVLVGEPFIEGSGACLAFAGLGSSYGSVEVIYSYASVPEPGTGWAGFAASVFSGIWGFARLRRSRA
jgi:hypothetical protein